MLSNLISYTNIYSIEDLYFIIKSKTVVNSQGKTIEEKALIMAKELLNELLNEIKDERYIKLPFKMGAYWYLFRRYVYENRNKLKKNIDEILEISPDYAFLNTDIFFSKKFTKIIHTVIYILSFKNLHIQSGNQIDVGLIMAYMKIFEKGKVFSPLFPRLENKGYCECYTGKNSNEYIFTDYPDIALVREDEFWNDWEYFPLWDGTMDGPIFKAHRYLYNISQETGYEEISNHGYLVDEWLD